MKLTKGQEKRLKEMCFEKKTNKEIAAELGIELTDVHAARSRLGITIPKVEAILTENKDKPLAIAKRTEDEIQEEIKKVLRSKSEAYKKIKRCDERIEELLDELVKLEED